MSKKILIKTPKGVVMREELFSLIFRDIMVPAKAHNIVPIIKE